jgi:long-chain acyl-CoA synthetase
MSTDLSDLLPPGFPAMSVRDAHIFITQTPGSPLELEETVIRGVTFKTWKNAPKTLRDVFQVALAHAGRTYLVLEDERVTYDQNRRAALKLAAQFQADGVKKGDRIAIIMRNLPEWVTAYWAGLLVGAIVTPMNAWWTGPELEYGLQDSGTKIIIADHERWQRIAPHIDACPSVEKIYVARAPEPVSHKLVVAMEDVLPHSSTWSSLPEGELPDVEIEADDDANIFYTSGTTGKPKGAILSHRNIISNMFNAANASARAFMRRGELPPAPDPEAPQKSSLISVPFFHATGTCAILIPSLFGGAKLVMQRRWDADGALQLIQDEKINSAGGVPTIAWQILEHPRFDEYDLSSLETISYGGAPSAPELVRRIKERFPKSQPGQGWGMTETSATAVSNTAEDYIRKPASCGVAAASGEAKIMSPDGAELGVDEVGELWYKGPIVVRGYWNKPEATAETFVDGWVKTGDLARIDEEGFVYIVDRAKDMLIRGGENIYCVEVENALYDHPAVMDAAVIGRPHKTLGEEPVAVVHLKPDQEASEAELRAFVATKIASFKVPVAIHFLTDNLPRNANGKILKRDLKTMFVEAAQ